MAIEFAHVLLAALLFFLVNWVGRHSISAGYQHISLFEDVEDAPAFNAVFRVVAPLVFLICTSAFWYSVGLDEIVQNYYDVIVYYFLIRWTFNVVLGRRLLLSWSHQAVLALVTVGLSIAVYRILLESRTLLLPDPKQLRDQLWIVVILFLYQAANRVAPFGGHNYAERRATYVKTMYRRFRSRYGELITREACEEPIEVLSYAVLMYESFNRPPLYQFIESHVLYPLGLSHSFGPMQVRAASPLSAEESVIRGVRKLKRDFAASRVEVFGADWKTGEQAANSWWERRRVVELTARKYNVRSDYPYEVAGIFGEIAYRFYPALRGVWIGLG